MAAHSVSLGITLMVLAGVSVTAEMVFSMTMLQMRWPYWRITALSCMLCSVPAAALLVHDQRNRKSPTTIQLKWVALLGIFSAVYWGLAIVAVQIGVDPGDVAALTSVNIIAAAVMGRIFLNEGFRFLQMAAVVFSLSGAVLVAQPAFIFGASSADGRGPWYGYLCAITSGFLQGGFFICSRKAGDVSAGQPLLSALLFSCPLCALLPFTPLVEEAPVSIALTVPLEGLGWTAVAFLTTMGSAFFSVAGSMLCPAAISATVYTAASMFFGYIAQTVFFGAKPEPLTVAGACLMLAAVALMAFAGRTTADIPENDERSGGETNDKSEQTTEASGMSDAEDDTESFTSFVASEFSDFDGSRESLRFRGSASQLDSVCPEQVGATC